MQAPVDDKDSVTTRPLAERGVIVTGAARGIGLAIAERLAARGATLALIDRDPSVEDRAGELGAHCVGYTVDLRDAQQTTSVVDAAAEAMGGLWAVVNNAGIFAKTPLLEIDLNEWDEMMNVNVRSMLVMIQAAVPHMVACGGGRIVNQSSMAAKLGTPGEAHYAASKAAVSALTRIAALELGPKAITVNAVCPGYVLTEMGAETRDPDQIREWTAKSPLGRLAGPDDIARAVAFLVSDEAAYITGESLNVSGGMCMW